jgi:predicted dehydrogenase
MRVAVVGAGANIWPFHRNAIRATGGTVVAVHDVDADRARAVAADTGAPAVDSLAALLDVESDVVVVLAPHPAHHALARAALAAGRHVLVEKPIAVTVDEARDLCAAAKAADRLLAVCFQQRTRTELIEARRLVTSGALGELQRVDLLGTWPRRTAYFATAPWRGTWRGEGGGILINQGQHNLDALCFVAGQPASVYAVTRNAIHPTETEDTAGALLCWAGGAIGGVHLSSAELDTPMRIEVTGTAGRLRVQPGRLEVFRNEMDFHEYARSDGDPYAAPRVTELPPFRTGGGRHEEIYANLRDALATGADLVATGDSATLTLELSAAIMISAHERATVELPLPPGRHAALLAELTHAEAP